MRGTNKVNNDKAPYTARDVHVIATFYDSADKVVMTNSTFTNPRNIPSGEKEPSASIPLEQIDHYDLKVGWN